MAQSEEEHLKDPENQAESAETGAEAGVEDQVSDETPADSDEAQSASEPLEVSPEKALEEALADVEKFKDTALRAEAEMQNMQRRTARDVENAHKFGLERFLQNLLPVVDSLEKAIESTDQAGDDAGEAIAEGIVLCHKLLLDVLGKENIEVIDPVGAPFDPNEHQAMSMVENPDMEPNSVFSVVQKGYKLNGRLVRAAMVMVTKAPASSADEGEDTVADP